MKIGFFFGSFDPPHLGHLILPSFAIKKFNLDKIIYVPSFKSVNKDNHYSSCNDRYNMIKLLIKDQPQLFIEKYELEKESQTYTYETLSYLKQKYKLEKSDFFLCIGSDWIEKLSTWKNFEIIKSNVNFIIFKRNPFNLNIDEIMEAQGIDKNSYFLLENQIDISSSEIRELISKNENFSYLLSESVYKYIIDKGLYQWNYQKPYSFWLY